MQWLECSEVEVVPGKQAGVPLARFCCPFPQGIKALSVPGSEYLHHLANRISSTRFRGPSFRAEPEDCSGKHG